MARNGLDQDAFISLRRLKNFWSNLKTWLASRYVSKTDFNALKARVEALEALVPAKEVTPE